MTASMDALKVVRAWETGGAETVEEGEEEAQEAAARNRRRRRNPRP